jgi:hypothetical protein
MAAQAAIHASVVARSAELVKTARVSPPRYQESSLKLTWMAACAAMTVVRTEGGWRQSKKALVYVGFAAGARTDRSLRRGQARDRHAIG